jgi:phosphoglycerate dehydrogenase-like enzyme
MTRILVIPEPALYHRVFTSEADAGLRVLGDVTFLENRISSADLAALIGGYEVVITSWGTPKFTDEVLNAASNLKLIAHAAGSIKAMLPPAVFERDIQVTHAATAMAQSVAELALTLMMMMMRRVVEFDRVMKAGMDWEEAKNVGWGLDIAGTRVGVVGAGYVGRRMIALLKAVQAEVVVYDPYLSDEAAQDMGVEKADLHHLLRTCPAITFHAPQTEETYHMIGAAELRLVQDRAAFVNTSRGTLIDQEALTDELQTGRFWAALDVFEREPLPVDDPLRKLPNVILLPHMASKTVQADARIGEVIVAEVGRYLNGQPLRYPVTGDMLRTMA